NAGQFAISTRLIIPLDTLAEDHRFFIGERFAVEAFEKSPLCRTQAQIQELWILGKFDDGHRTDSWMRPRKWSCPNRASPANSRYLMWQTFVDFIAVARLFIA